MKRKICKTELSKNVLFLIDFVDKQNYSEMTTLNHLIKDAREKFYPLLEFDKLDDVERGLYIREITKVDYWSIQETSYEQRWSYLYFAEMLSNALDLDFNKNRVTYKLTRKVSPPLEALYPKDNFKPSGRDYGLLFE